MQALRFDRDRRHVHLLPDEATRALKGPRDMDDSVEKKEKGSWYWIGLILGVWGLLMAARSGDRSASREAVRGFVTGVVISVILVACGAVAYLFYIGSVLEQFE